MSTRLKALYEQMILNIIVIHVILMKLIRVRIMRMVLTPYVVMILTFMFTVKDGQIEDIGFKGQGCAISKSSGSLMASALKGSF